MRVVSLFGGTRTVGVLLLAALVVVRASDPAPLEELRLRSFDYYQILKPRRSVARPVVIVDIDENSLRAFGQWPWPRTLLADLVKRLHELQCAAIGFDMVFAEPDRLSPGVAVKSFRNIDEATRETLQRLPSNDEIFADSIRGLKVVLGQAALSSRPAAPPIENPVPETGFAIKGPDPSNYLITLPGLLRNVTVLEKAAAGRGILTVRTEPDGIVRRIPMVLKVEGQFVPSLSLELLRVITGAGAILVKTDKAGVRSVAIPGLEIPTDQNGQLWVHFGPHDPARYVSARDVIDGRVPRERIAGKLVLIGTSAVGLGDLKTTPVTPSMPGVEIQAQILETMLSGDTLAYPYWAPTVELGAAVLSSIVIIAAAPIVPALALLLLGGLLGGGVAALSWWLYAWHGILLDATFPLAAIFLIYVVLVLINYVREQTQRRRIRSAFNQYLSPILVEQLASSPQKVVLGGEDRVVSVLFSDVRGFTTISELHKDDPQGLTTLMNRLLTPLTHAIIDRKGTIDKYMGDAVMAFWNAPLDDPEHEVNACEAALDMLDGVQRLNRARRQEAVLSGRDFAPIAIGVGVNTGRVVVGNMGSDLRFQYTVIGDPVNLASRLESQTKYYGVPIIIGARTASALERRFATLEIDSVRVKGKTEPEVIHAVLGRDELAGSPEFRQTRELIAEILNNYRLQDWGRALTAIEACRPVSQEFGIQGLIELYAERIRHFQLNPPPANWDGVFVSTVK